jgi:hypothetical protein
MLKVEYMYHAYLHGLYNAPFALAIANFSIISCRMFNFARLDDLRLWMAVVYGRFSEGRSALFTFLKVSRIDEKLLVAFMDKVPTYICLEV